MNATNIRHYSDKGSSSMNAIISLNTSQVNTARQISNNDDLTQHIGGSIVYLPLQKDPRPKTYYPSRLSRLTYDLLVVIRDDYMARQVSERLSGSLAIRFGCHKTTVRKAWKYLDDIGFTISKHGGKGSPSQRWITFEGFSFLDNQLLHQTLHLNLPTPYIDLSMKEEGDQDLVLGEQNCGQIEAAAFEEEEIEPEEAIEKLVEGESNPLHHEQAIKNAIKRSPLSSVKKKSLLNRVLAVKKNKPIVSIRNYFMTSLVNEEKKHSHLMNHFLSNGGRDEVPLYC